MISGSLIDNDYIKNALTEKFFINGTVENIYFSNHDAARNVIDKNSKLFLVLKAKIWKVFMKCKKINFGPLKSYLFGVATFFLMWFLSIQLNLVSGSLNK